MLPPWFLIVCFYLFCVRSFTRCLHCFLPDARPCTRRSRLCQTIASAAPHLPFYYYHIPEMTGVAFAMRDLVAEVAAIPEFTNFVGIKYTGLCVSYSCVWAG